MSKHLMIEIAMGVVILALVVFVVVDQYHKAVATAATEARIAERQAAKAELDAAQKASDQKYQDAQKEWNAKFDRLDKMTPREIVEKAPQYIPLPKPVIIAGPDTQSVPVGSAIVPPEDIKPLGQVILDGKKCTETDLPKCQFDLKISQDQFKLRDQDAKDWEKQAKGGSFGSKLWGCTKIGGFGALGGMLPNDTDKNGNSHRLRNGGIGFGLTFVPCMFIKNR